MLPAAGGRRPKRGLSHGSLDFGEQPGRPQHARENGEQVRRVFCLGGRPRRVAYTDTVEEGAAFLQQAVEAQPDLLVCCGGDGTLSQALNVLQQLDAKLPLGYVPMGTTNDFAASLGLPKEPAKAAEQILHGQPRLLGFGPLWGAGVPVRGLLWGLYPVLLQSGAPGEGRPGPPGLCAGKRQGAALSAGLLPPGGYLGDALYEREYLFGAVSNTLSVGGILKLDPQVVHLDDGLLELTLVRMPKNPVELGQAAAMLGRGKYDGDLVLQRTVRRAVLTCGEEFPWSLDGEYVPGAAQIEIETLPQALELVL